MSTRVVCAALVSLLLLSGSLVQNTTVQAQTTQLYLPGVLRGIPVVTTGHFADLATYATSPGSLVVMGFLSGLSPYITLVRADGGQPEHVDGNQVNHRLTSFLPLVADSGYDTQLLTIELSAHQRLLIHARSTLAGAPLRTTDIALATQRCNSSSPLTYERITNARLYPGAEARHLYLVVTCMRTASPQPTREYHYALRSVDSGVTWAEIVNPDDHDDSLKAFKVSRADRNTVFRIDFQSRNGYVSADGGGTWTAFERPYLWFTTSPTARQTWYSWSETAGAVTTDGGASWQSWSTPAACASGRHTDLVALQGTPEGIALLCAPYGPVALSLDRGQTWTVISTPPGYQAERLFPNEGSPETLLAFVRSASPTTPHYGALLQASAANPVWLEWMRLSGVWP